MTDQQQTLLSSLVNRAVMEIEGQVIEIPLGIARDDELLRRSLAPLFPGAANAKFERKEENDLLTVKVIKQFGTKGSPLDNLIAVPESFNSAIQAYKNFLKIRKKKLSAEDLMAIDKEIEDAIFEGAGEKNMMKSTKKFMEFAPSVPAKIVPPGF